VIETKFLLKSMMCHHRWAFFNITRLQRYFKDSTQFRLNWCTGYSELGKK